VIGPLLASSSGSASGLPFFPRRSTRGGRGGLHLLWEENSSLGGKERRGCDRSNGVKVGQSPINRPRTGPCLRSLSFELNDRATSG
jgi:hypothetical protein